MELLTVTAPRGRRRDGNSSRGITVGGRGGACILSLSGGERVRVEGWGGTHVEETTGSIMEKGRRKEILVEEDGGCKDSQGRGIQQKTHKHGLGLPNTD